MRVVSAVRPQIQTRSFVPSTGRSSIVSPSSAPCVAGLCSSHDLDPAAEEAWECRSRIRTICPSTLYQERLPRSEFASLGTELDDSVAWHGAASRIRPGLKHSRSKGDFAMSISNQSGEARANSRNAGRCCPIRARNAPNFDRIRAEFGRHWAERARRRSTLGQTRPNSERLPQTRVKFGFESTNSGPICRICAEFGQTCSSTGQCWADSAPLLADFGQIC